MSYQLRRQANGSYSLFHAELGETMHPQLGPWEEARRVYVQGTGLEALLTARGRPAPGAETVVFDVGLGGAANAVAAIQAVAELRRSGERVRHLRIVSFEQDLAAPAFALAHALELDYLRGHEPALQALLAHGQWTSGGVTWELRAGDFPRLIEDEPRRSDVVFFDPFSPRSNPAMWSVALLENVYRCHRPGRPMTLATYSSAFGVRAALLLAGFYVGEGPVLSGMRHATLAATDFSLLREPLDRAWLGRWRRDREPWPPLSLAHDHRRIRENLLSHPQWSHFEGGTLSAEDETGAPLPPPRRRRRRG
jgi:tRNA U34 5-methylaminomethyl-2-thiouridine-forming methyltransferase MnmC